MPYVTAVNREPGREFATRSGASPRPQEQAGCEQARTPGMRPRFHQNQRIGSVLESLIIREDFVNRVPKIQIGEDVLFRHSYLARYFAIEPKLQRRENLIGTLSPLIPRLDNREVIFRTGKRSLHRLVCERQHRSTDVAAKFRIGVFRAERGTRGLRLPRFFCYEFYRF